MNEMDDEIECPRCGLVNRKIQMMGNGAIHADNINDLVFCRECGFKLDEKFERKRHYEVKTNTSQNLPLGNGVSIEW